MELNPNNPTTAAVRDQWHKLCAILILKGNVREVEITTADVARLEKERLSIVADCRGGKLVLRLVDEKEGERLARQEGGLPA